MDGRGREGSRHRVGGSVRQKDANIVNKTSKDSFKIILCTEQLDLEDILHKLGISSPPPFDSINISKRKASVSSRLPIIAEIPLLESKKM